MEFINTGLDERILKSLDVEHPSEELVKAMNKQGLVQKEVTVQGKNGTFTRKQWVKASEVKDSSVSQSTMTQEEFNKKYPNGGMQDPVECLKYNGSDATWHGEKLQNPSVMKRAKEEYAQFKKDKAALEAGKSESSKTSAKKNSKSEQSTQSNEAISNDKSKKDSVSSKLSPADAKKKTQEVTKDVSDKKSFMEKAKAQGITWKENDHEGINWMRCCMAMNKHFENGGTFDNSINNSSTTGSSVNTSYTPFPTQTPQSIKDLYGKSKPKSPRLNATHIFETSKKSLADSGKLSPSSLKILKKAHFQVAMDNAYQTMLDKYKTGFERDAITGYIGFYIKNDGFGTSSKVDQVFDKLSKKYNMSSTELFDKSNKLYEEFMGIFDKYQVAIADNEFPEIKYELVSKVNRKYMNSK